MKANSNRKYTELENPYWWGGFQGRWPVQSHRTSCSEGPWTPFNIMYLPSWNSQFLNGEPTFLFCTGFTSYVVDSAHGRRHCRSTMWASRSKEESLVLGTYLASLLALWTLGQLVGAAIQVLSPLSHLVHVCSCFFACFHLPWSDLREWQSHHSQWPHTSGLCSVLSLPWGRLFPTRLTLYGTLLKQ